MFVSVPQGMLNTGIGETHLNNLLSVLNVPGISKKTLKKREREVGKNVEAIAKECCEEALQEEIKKTSEK